MTTSHDWDRLAGEYESRSGLMPPERELLRRLRDRLPTIAMLDLGIGAGRTTEVFAPLVRRYVGVDYSERMIERARRRVGEKDAEGLVVADARDLSRWKGVDFDVVLFSFNGIDYVEIADRERILREVRSAIAPQGTFAFSTHSLNALPLPLPPVRPSARDPLRSTIRSLGRRARVAFVNQSLDLEQARQRGWIRIRDGAHDFSIPSTTYVDPSYQLREIEAAGFRVDEVLDTAGSPVEPLDPGREPHLFYVCTAA